MGFKSKFSSSKLLVVNNKKIIENYFFMTLLQVLNSFFYLLIYPYLIRILGTDNYGLFVFATSISTYFTFFINFGFDLPATKEVAKNVHNINKISEILSIVFTAKIYLLLISLFVFSGILVTVPMLQQNSLVFLLCFFQIISSIIFPQWYFQAVQKMRIVTYIQLGLKLISLPFIFLLVTEENDLIIYTVIVTLSTIIGGLIAFMIVIFNHKIKIQMNGFSTTVVWFKEAFPFFLSTSAGVIKEQSIIIVIGAFFGMKEVAIYDLASKIISVPRTIFMSINAAIFPKLINDIKSHTIKKIIKYETIISLSVIVFIIIFGKFLVQLLGGQTMLPAYPLAILLSVTVMTWLVVGAYISFVFIPQNKYYLVTKNQIIALSSFVIYALVGLFIFKNILIFGAAMALSGLTEILYCKYITKKNKLL